jgi:hypothetical protein
VATDYSISLGGNKKTGLGPGIWILTAALFFSMVSLLWLVRYRWVGGLRIEVDKTASVVQEQDERISLLLSQLGETTRKVQALEEISGVEMVIGKPGEALGRTDVKLPYVQESGLLIHKRSSRKLYYLVGTEQTLGDIAAHPRILGAWYLWPLLSEGNGLSARSGSHRVRPGEVLAVPTKVTRWTMRQATTTAGAPDAVREEIFRQGKL